MIFIHSGGSVPGLNVKINNFCKTKNVYDEFDFLIFFILMCLPPTLKANKPYIAGHWLITDPSQRNIRLFDIL